MLESKTGQKLFEKRFLSVMTCS